MPDALDHAQGLETLQRDLALEQHARRANRFNLPSRTHCLECDAEIPPARRALGGVERCTECQGYYDREQQQRR